MLHGEPSGGRVAGKAEDNQPRKQNTLDIQTLGENHNITPSQSLVSRRRVRLIRIVLVKPGD